ELKLSTALLGDVGYKGARETYSLDVEKTRGLTELAARNRVTLNTVIRVIWALVLGKYTGKEDVVFGAVVSGRPSEIEGIESMIGLFINSIPVRIGYKDETPFNKLLQKMQEEALESESHHYYPLAEIQSHTFLKQNLLDHIMAFENFPLADQIDGLSVSGENGGKEVRLETSDVEVFEQSNYDLNIVLTITGNRLNLAFIYNGNAYGKDFIARTAGIIEHLVDQTAGNDAIEIGRLELLKEAEKKQLLFDFNDTGSGYPDMKTLHELFEEQVDKKPEATAAVYEDEGLTYRELNGKANRLAHTLRAKGVEPGTIVGIMTERCLEMIWGILGILKAGGAYLPILSNYPENRIHYMLDNSAASILLTKIAAVKGKSFAALREIIFLDKPEEAAAPGGVENPGPLNRPSDLAYIIFTSGTTGKPKGVMVDHKNVIPLMKNNAFQFDFSHGDVWTMFHSLCFDFSVWEMYGALLYGGKLVVVPEMVAKDPWKFFEFLKKERVTVLNQVPSSFYNLVDVVLAPSAGDSPSPDLHVRYVIFGGESLQPAKLKEWKKSYPRIRLVNMFGITETTVFVTFKEFEDKDIEFNISNIGKPIPNLTTYVMDKNLNLVPFGVAGELCVGGKGVARGYLNRPGLTGEKFVENPHIPGELLYRSGDLARMAADGDLEYLGRIDRQVKIRGFRIETGEIENQLLSYGKVKEVLVLAREDAGGDKFLCAYIVPVTAAVEGAKGLEVQELREMLSANLPDYMIPAHFVQLEKMPLTPNGKVDRQALPDPADMKAGEMDMGAAAGDECEAPRNAVEETVMEICRQLLGREKVGINDDFFM
ncbi:MAG: amino acid adenylation domain-containing protein, partial [bacterium]|nr:amino acid adenylation domain-containing protein [bacterium]